MSILVVQTCCAVYAYMALKTWTCPINKNNNNNVYSVCVSLFLCVCVCVSICRWIWYVVTDK